MTEKCVVLEPWFPSSAGTRLLSLVVFSEPGTGGFKDIVIFLFDGVSFPFLLLAMARGIICRSELRSISYVRLADLTCRHYKGGERRSILFVPCHKLPRDIWPPRAGNCSALKLPYCHLR